MNGSSATQRLAFSPFLLLCATGLFAIFSSTMSKSPVLPLFAKQLGATEANIGFIAAASTVVGILASIPAGALSDIYGRRRVILAAMLIFATAPFLYLLVTTPWQLALVRIFHGFATAIFGPVALALVADLFKTGRGESMGWYSSATLLGRSVAPAVGGLILLTAAYPWRLRRLRRRPASSRSRSAAACRSTTASSRAPRSPRAGRSSARACATSSAADRSSSPRSPRRCSTSRSARSKRSCRSTPSSSPGCPPSRSGPYSSSRC